MPGSSLYRSPDQGLDNNPTLAPAPPQDEEYKKKTKHLGLEAEIQAAKTEATLTKTTEPKPVSAQNWTAPTQPRPARMDNLGYLEAYPGQHGTNVLKLEPGAQLTTEQEYTRADLILGTYDAMATPILADNGEGYDWSKYGGGFTQFKTDVYQARADRAANRASLATWRDMMLNPKPYHEDTRLNARYGELRAQDRELTQAQLNKERESYFSSYEAATTRLTDQGIIKPITMSPRIAKFYTAQSNEIPGYELEADVEKLNASQLNDLATLGFKLNKPASMTKTPELTARERALYLGVGVTGHEADIWAKQGGLFSLAGRQMVAHANELKLNGKEINTGAMKGNGTLSLDNGKLTKPADAEAALWFAGGGAVGGIGGLVYGGDILGDVTQNPLSATIQVGVIAATMADIGYEGSQILNRRFGITNKAFLGRLPDEAFMIDQPSGRLGGYAMETYDQGLELADFRKYADELNARASTPTARTYGRNTFYELKNPSQVGLSLDEADLPKADLKGRPGLFTFKKGRLYSDLTGLTPHGDYTTFTDQSIAELIGRFKREYPTVDLTNLAQRESDAADFEAWIHDYNADFNVKQAAKLEAAKMSGAVEHGAPNGGIPTELGGKGGTLTIQRSRVGSYPMSSRGAMPNPYYATQAQDLGLELTGQGSQDLLDLALMRSIMHGSPQMSLTRPKAMARLSTPQMQFNLTPTSSAQKKENKQLMAPILASLEAPIQLTKQKTPQIQIQEPRLKQAQIQIPKIKAPRETRPILQPPGGRVTEPLGRKPFNLKLGKESSTRRGKGKKERAAWLVKLYPITSPEEMLGLTNFTRPTRRRNK